MTDIDVLLLGPDQSSFTQTVTTQPGVADPEMEQLVNEKVDVFWKGIESGSSKRGQVPSLVSCPPATRVLIASCARRIDPGHFFGKEA